MFVLTLPRIQLLNVVLPGQDLFLVQPGHGQQLLPRMAIDLLALLPHLPDHLGEMVVVERVGGDLRRVGDGPERLRVDFLQQQQFCFAVVDQRQGSDLIGHCRLYLPILTRNTQLFALSFMLPLELIHVALEEVAACGLIGFGIEARGSLGRERKLALLLAGLPGHRGSVCYLPDGEGSRAELGLHAIEERVPLLALRLSHYRVHYHQQNKTINYTSS